MIFMPLKESYEVALRRMGYYKIYKTNRFLTILFYPFPFPFPSKIRGTMPRVIYPALKEARHPGYKRDNKEY